MASAPPLLRRRTLLGGASLAATSLLASGCSLQIRSRPDPTIGPDTMLVAGDKGTPTFTANFNPFHANKRTAASILYEPLIWINPLDGELVPWLAESWDQPDPQRIVLTLREGVSWHDGTPLTGEDVDYTFRMLQDFPANDVAGAWGRIDTLEVDGRTIAITLKSPDSPALPVIGQTVIVPRHLWEGVADPSTWRNEEPVGSGPFQLGTFTALQYTLDRFPGHWQASSIDIEHLVYPAASEELDLVTKGYDWAYAYMSDVENTWMAANDANRYWFPPGGIIGLHPNHDVAPFDDVDVRRGLALALDGRQVAEVAAEGYMDEASQSGLLLPNQEDLLDPSLPERGIIGQDTQAAIAAFEKAGFTYDGTTMRTPEGEPFTFAITTANGYTDWLRAVQEVQRELGAIGIAVDIDAPQPAAYEANLSSGDYQVAVGSSNGSDAFQGFSNLMSGEYYVPVGETSQNNRIRYRSAEADELITRYRASVDEAEQSEILHALQRLFHTDLPVIALYYGGLWGLYNQARFTGWPTAEDPYAPLQTYGSSPLLVLTRLRRAQKEAS
ncbi:peptide ABC transporter substrate-binding protein [Brachybacterium phenoliresistens]|uniref:Peptide ABC transporter substrate-binding protein n=1 Tax=Brachybacterium phenoliresistens TaxID=396014 RepID=Z9JP13_9MICO|nr:ABC transporter substrate-binding protein [Brachybacterium phenoliresistens]EWS80150.1 peptide ABC transporter substrate-binding protein [Brachybacterium phenoliresistens]